MAGGRRRAVQRAVVAAIAAGLCWLVPTLEAVAYTRYHTGPGVYLSAPMDEGYSSRSLLPPIAWVFQDWEGTYATCPVLIAVGGVAVVGFVLQHCMGRCLNFQRIAVFYPPTLKAGELWRLFTHAALHSDCGHLVVNLLHLLNTLDLEGVPPGSGYPSSYALGSQHVAGAAGLATAYAALVGSVTCFGAMFEGASALCFGLDGALLGSCAVLLGAGAESSLEGFLQVRGIYAVIHMGIDILRGCSNPYGSIGNVSHLAGFFGGFAYVILVMPELGGRPLPTVRCNVGRGYEECFAFFTPDSIASVREVHRAARGLLIFGSVAALANTFIRHRAVHASADGYSVLVRPPAQQEGNLLGNAR